MNSLFTEPKYALYAVAFAFGFISTNQTEAQVCGASTYACGNAYGYCGDIDAITIKDISGTLCTFSGKKCTTTTSHLGVINAGSPINLTSGQTIIVDITGTSWSGYINSTKNNGFGLSKSTNSSQIQTNRNILQTMNLFKKN